MCYSISKISSLDVHTLFLKWIPATLPYHRHRLSRNFSSVVFVTGRVKLLFRSRLNCAGPTGSGRRPRHLRRHLFRRSPPRDKNGQCRAQSVHRHAHFVFREPAFESHGKFSMSKKSLHPFCFVRSDPFSRQSACFLLKPKTERDRLESRLIDKGKLLEREGRKAAGLT